MAIGCMCSLQMKVIWVLAGSEQLWGFWPCSQSVVSPVLHLSCAQTLRPPSVSLPPLKAAGEIKRDRGCEHLIVFYSQLLFFHTNEREFCKAEVTQSQEHSNRRYCEQYQQQRENKRDEKENSYINQSNML